tara:strand:+ start:114990 stop:115148 length:159 start_codon:yes stop_codon:yes gene_type:complete
MTIDDDKLSPHKAIKSYRDAENQLVLPLFTCLVTAGHDNFAQDRLGSIHWGR